MALMPGDRRPPHPQARIVPGDPAFLVVGLDFADLGPPNFAIPIEAVAAPLEAIAGLVSRVLDSTPPGISTDILTHGLVLTGGGAKLRHLDLFLSERSGMKVRVADHRGFYLRAARAKFPHRSMLQARFLYR